LTADSLPSGSFGILLSIEECDKFQFSITLSYHALALNPIQVLQTRLRHGETLQGWRREVADRLLKSSCAMSRAIPSPLRNEFPGAIRLDAAIEYEPIARHRLLWRAQDIFDCFATPPLPCKHVE
jgi:hypothetical protein